MRWRWRWIAMLAGAVPGACIEAEPFQCRIGAQCEANGLPGICDPATSTCLYMAPGCPGGFADASGECKRPSDEATGSDGGDGGDDGGSTPADTSGGSAADTTSDGDSSGAPAGCDGPIDITDQGVVGADSVFDEFQAQLAVDADTSTSWFSTGPESDGAPTNYTWMSPTERCLEHLTILGNGDNATAEFRTDFGFESMTVRVFDAGNDLVFEQAYTLAGTPDPDTEVELGGVRGQRVVLALAEHEDEACGGFSELVVLGEP